MQEEQTSININENNIDLSKILKNDADHSISNNIDSKINNNDLEIRNIVRQNLSTENVEPIFKNITKQGVNMLELTINPFYECKRFSKDLCNDDNIEFWTCVEQIRIENFSIFSYDPPPLIKLMSIISFSMYTKHTINKLEDA